jgi:hypothetical protein
MAYFLVHPYTLRYYVVGGRGSNDFLGFRIQVQFANRLRDACFGIL